MSKLAKALTAAAGNAGESLYVEDVFSTLLYSDTYASSTVNGIDLAGEGGLVWIKKRASVANHFLYDTERGVEKALLSNSTGAEFTATNSLTSFNSDGFSLGTYSNTNSGVAWTFRKAEKFFDVVTYTGDGVTTGRTVAHNLGSVPAVMIVKCTTTATGWLVYHSSIGATKYLQLNASGAEASGTFAWNDTAPTDSVFTVGSSPWANTNGDTYVAYLFASDAGGFGDDGSESIIKCGSYTGTGSAGLEVDLGFEPQWLMFKRTDSTSDWSMFDVMRGIATGGNDARLRAQGSDAENEFNYVDVTSTGFSLSYGGADMNASGGNYIYIAIRRPMKTPESGTEVFSPVAFTGNGVSGRVINAGFSVDTSFGLSRSTTFNNSVLDRIRGNDQFLYTSLNIAEATKARWAFDEQDGIRATTIGADGNNSGDSRIHYFLKRATGFFDLVAYSGDGTSNRLIPHNLSVTPEFIIIKRRTNNGSGDADAEAWAVWNKDVLSNSIVYLDRSNPEVGYAGDTYYPSYSTFTQYGENYLNTGNLSQGQAWVNSATETYIAYLFATLAGVSKVGSYTGTGSNVDVDCGFSAGARFVLIKRTDSTGDWYVYDSARGIVAGNDPYLLFNTAAVEVTSTDYIDPLSSGFTVTSSAPAALNASGGTYIFLAIA